MATESRISAKISPALAGVPVDVDPDLDRRMTWLLSRKRDYNH
ncbi:hypothetical protein [Mycolicibacterium mengxianglii]|nr:hypothetical protein [Mycolicibacterium mengxianglii]